MTVSLRYGDYLFSEATVLRPKGWDQLLENKVYPSNIIDRHGKVLNEPVELSSRKISIKGKLKAATQAALETAEEALMLATCNANPKRLWFWDDKYVNARVMSVQVGPVEGSGVLAQEYTINFYCDDPWLYGSSLTQDIQAWSKNAFVALDYSFVHASVSAGPVYPIIRLTSTGLMGPFTVTKTNGETLSQIVVDSPITYGIGYLYQGVACNQGQSFTPTRTAQVKKIKVNLQKVGSPSGFVTQSVYATSGGVITGPALGTSRAVSTAIITGGSWITFTYDGGPTLSASVVYAFTYSYTYAASASNYVKAIGDITSPSYTGGKAQIYPDTSTALFGNEAIDRAGGWDHFYTIIDQLNPATTAGILTDVNIYADVGGDIKVKVFRSNGDNWDFVGESETFNINPGSNSRTLTSPITGVQVGDFIGIYIPDSAIVDATTPGGTASVYFADITSNTAKSGWSSNNYIISVRATITTIAAAWKSDNAKDCGFYVYLGDTDTSDVIIVDILEITDGQVLEIDCERMTVTLDGVDILDDVTAGADLDMMIYYGSNSFRVQSGETAPAETGTVEILYNPRRW